MADAKASAETGGKVRVHPWVSYVLCALLAVASLAILVISPNPIEEAAKSPEMLAARTFFERNPDVEVSGRLAHWIGEDEMARIRAEHDARRDTGSVAVLSQRMRDKSQQRFDAIQRAAFSSLQELPSWRLGVVDGESSFVNRFAHLAVYETVAALAVSLLFFALCAITLEGAWGSLLFGGFCLLVPLVSSTAYTSLYGTQGVPWIGASGMVAGMLGAYLVRSFRGFTIPVWVLLPAWLLGEYLLARDLPIDRFDATPFVVHGLSFAFGAAAAGAIWVLGLEEKLHLAQADTPDLVSNPVLEQALLERENGNHESAFELLTAELRRAPGNHDAALALWQLSSGTDRARRAVPAILGSVRDSLRRNQREEACALWVALTAEIRDVQADGTLLVRMAEALLAQEEHEAALQTFALAVDAPKPLSSVLALRVVRGAKELDPGLAARAAAVALVDDQLPAAERAQMQALAKGAAARPAASARPAAAGATPAAAAKPAAKSAKTAKTAPATGAARAASAAPAAPAASSSPSPAPSLAPEPAPEPAPEIDPYQDPHALAADAFASLAEGESLAAPEDPSTWNQPGLVQDLSSELEDASAGFDWSGLQDEAVSEEKVAPVASPAPPAARPTAEPAPAARVAPVPVSPATAAPVAPAAPAESSDVSETTETTETLEPSSSSSSSPQSATAPELDAPFDAPFETPLRRLRARAAVPISLDDEGLSIEAEGGAKTVIDWSRIEAVAAGAVHGLADKPVLVVDVVLNWLDVPDEPLKVIRLRSDGFDPRRVVSGKSSALDALRAMLDELIGRSGATPLPSRDNALGNPFGSFADIASYDRSVLMCEG